MFELNPSWLNFCIIWGAPPLFFLKLIFGLGGGDFHLKSQYFIGLRLPWKFEPNPSWFNFFLIWGAPPLFFCLNSGFGWGGVNFFIPNPILMLGWDYPEILRQIRVGWIFAWFGVPPPFFCLNLSFGWRGVKNFTSNHNSLLVWGYLESLSQIPVGWIFAWFGVVPPLFS